MERSLRVLDGAVALYCAVGGVQPQYEQVWRQSEKYKVPKIAFVNKMDRVGANFYSVMEQMKNQLGANPVPVVIPIGAAETFEGVVDLIKMKALYFDMKSLGKTVIEKDIPEEYVEKAKEWRQKMLESAAEQDDALMEKFFAGEELTNEEIEMGLRKGCLSRAITPAFCGTAFKDKGIQPLLDGVCKYLPSPLDTGAAVSADDPTQKREVSDTEPFCGLAFKIMNDPKSGGKITFVRVYSGTLKLGEEMLDSTIDKEQRISRLFRMHANKQEPLDEAHAGDIVACVGLTETRTGDTLCDPAHPITLESIDFPAPVISVAVKPKSRGDNEKLGVALHALAMEDPTFVVTFDQETSETIIAGMGELYLEVIVDRLKREFNVDCDVGAPQVAYRETITTKVENEYKHVKQSGGRGQYAHVCLRLEPQEPGTGFEFVNEIKGGVIPTEYIPAVEKGVRKALEAGPMAGFPVVDVKATVYFGSYHEVDSNEFACDGVLRLLPRGRLERIRVRDLRDAVLQAGVHEGQAPAPRADDGRRGGGARAVHGRGERLDQPAPRPHRGHGGPRGRQAPQGHRPARRDVRLLERHPHRDPGPRLVHDDLQAVRGGAEEHRLRGRREADQGRQGASVGRLMAGGAACAKPLTVRAGPTTAARPDRKQKGKEKCQR